VQVLSRSDLGGLVRAVNTPQVKAFARATEPLSALKGQAVTLSLDEHAIARFTRKFRIPKGFHTIRNKRMRVEKLFYLYWPAMRRFVQLRVTRGNATLADLTVTFLRALRSRVRLQKLRMILDAGAASSNEDLSRLNRFHKTVFLIRAPRRSGYVKAWKRLPRESFTAYEEPGRYKGAKAKVIEITETTTVIKGIARPVRTIVVREHAKRGKDRWHALFVLHDETTPALEVLHEYRTRQHHEQGHRIGVHDLWIDTSPSGYPKNGSPDRPGFRQGPLMLTAWIAALASDALRELSTGLPAAMHRAQPRTLRRWVLLRDAELIITPSHVLVVLESARRRAWLRPLIRRLNDAHVTLPWFGDRCVLMGFAASCQRLPDARPVLPELAEVRSDCAKTCGGVWC
jgi:hypothetical protein